MILTTFIRMLSSALDLMRGGVQAQSAARARLKQPLKMNIARARVKITTNPSFASRPAAAFAPPPGHQPLTSLITALSWRQFLRFFRIGDDKNRAE
jgi:hypothetical protein